MASVNFQKIKTAQEVKAKIRHDDMEKRLETNHTNLDIDKSKTHLNLNYFDDLNYEKVCKKYDDFLAKHDKLPNANKRKDRVTCVCLEIPTPDDLPPEKEDEFFYKVGDTLCEIYGKDNLLQGYFHKDEQHEYYHTAKKQDMMSKNHATFRFMPFVKDKDGNNRLLAKEFTARDKIIEVNNKVHDMCFREFGVQFNNGSKKKGKSVEELKRSSIKAVKELEAPIIDEAKKEAVRIANEIKAKAEDEANDIKQKAKKEADTLTSEAKAKADSIIKEADIKYHKDYDDGYENGYTAGKESFHEEYELPILQSKEDKTLFGKSKGTVSVPKEEFEAVSRAVKALIDDKANLDARYLKLNDERDEWYKSKAERKEQLENENRAFEKQQKKHQSELAKQKADIEKLQKQLLYLMQIKTMCNELYKALQNPKQYYPNMATAFIKDKGLLAEFTRYTIKADEDTAELIKQRDDVALIEIPQQSNDDFEL